MRTNPFNPNWEEPGDKLYKYNGQNQREGFFQLYDEDEGLHCLASPSYNDNELCYILDCPYRALDGHTRCSNHPWFEFDSDYIETLITVETSAAFFIGANDLGANDASSQQNELREACH